MTKEIPIVEFIMVLEIWKNEFALKELGKNSEGESSYKVEKCRDEITNIFQQMRRNLLRAEKAKSNTPGNTVKFYVDQKTVGKFPLFQVTFENYRVNAEREKIKNFLETAIQKMYLAKTNITDIINVDFYNTIPPELHPKLDHLKAARNGLSHDLKRLEHTLNTFKPKGNELLAWEKHSVTTIYTFCNSILDEYKNKDRNLPTLLHIDRNQDEITTLPKKVTAYSLASLFVSMIKKESSLNIVRDILENLKKDSKKSKLKLR